MPSPGDRPNAFLRLIAGVTAGLLVFPALTSSAQETDSELGFADVGKIRSQSPPGDLALSDAGRKKAEALSLYFKGLMLEDAVDTAQALECFREVIRLDPKNVELTLETANLGAAYGKFQESLELLEQSLEANPENPLAYLNLAQFCDTFHNGRNDYDERAVKYGKEAFERFPVSADACERYTALLTARDRHDEAQAALEKTLAAAPDDPNHWLRLGRIARSVYPAGGDEGSRGKVNAVFEKALELAAGNAGIARSVGDYYSLTRQYDRARAIYEDIVRGHPEELEVRERLVRVYRATGDMEKAMAALQELVGINPHREKTQELLAEMLETTGNRDEAIAHMEELLKLRDGEEPEYLRLLDLLFEARRFEDALKVARKAEALFPKSVIASRNVSLSLSLLERHDEAYAQWQVTEKLARENEIELTDKFYFEYGIAADSAGETDRAADLLRKAIERATENDDDHSAAEALNYLGYMWLEKGINIEEAGLLIRRAIQFVPEKGEFVDSLGWYYFHKEDYARALEQLLKAADLIAPPDPVIFDHVAQAYFKLGKNQEAEEYLLKALELDPENEELKGRLAEFRASGQEAG